jgi:ribosomal protein S18 acetylase RimI-like enzyme
VSAALTIREAREDELDRVSELMVAAYSEYRAVLAPADWQAYAADVADVRGRLPHSTLLVAERDGELAGAQTFYAPGARAPVPDDWAYVRLLAVAPAGRRRGTARALVEHAIARARELEAVGIAIHTTPWMAAALKLYRSLGFERAERYDFEPPGAVFEGRPLRVMAYRLALAST